MSGPELFSLIPRSPGGPLEAISGAIYWCRVSVAAKCSPNTQTAPDFPARNQCYGTHSKIVAREQGPHTRVRDSLTDHPPVLLVFIAQVA
jgi:hypothetical protein